MRQNWRPHVVNRDSSAEITRVHTAAIAQAFATHTRDVTSSSPQFRDGVNVSMPGSYPARGYTRAGSESPFTLAEQLEFVGMVLVDRSAVADADQNGVRQLRPHQVVADELKAFVERGRGLVAANDLGLGQQEAGERDPLLFARREHLG